ncbi:MAG: 30S ribosomal protein S9 [Chloroflexi bacterium]|jgi:small subunit ribosomal protein S9|nr:30S ribosomal protein S9 [Chloroflexota bacterium]MBT3669327.1 30S ribosomal protein S9 [Chloroflexota bacterium]MBT4003474.1 30S ribosomal protein S9 [Chloroflexota bacterium]MBT4306034.1 30S ribosomal protein S9 [Chloroflexota bacterium]MBT4532678.1 30S ribosomal protein S9 [Chloroflexota bacterium]
MAERYFEGIGRRKQATARVRLTKGKGAFVVNGKEVADYFPRFGDLDIINSPLEDGGAKNAVDISVLVKGGGTTGQVGAVRLGIARALIKMTPDVDRAMRKGGHITRDPRVKERKKPGLKKARKAPTYTKR